MRAIVRRDLHDEDAANYRWTNDELDRHIAHAVKDFSEAIPYEQKTTIATTAGSREIGYCHHNRPHYGRSSRVPRGRVSQKLPAFCPVGG
jgi:hypothetical protein